MTFLPLSFHALIAGACQEPGAFFFPNWDAFSSLTSRRLGSVSGVVLASIIETPSLETSLASGSSRYAGINVSSRLNIIGDPTGISDVLLDSGRTNFCLSVRRVGKPVGDGYDQPNKGLKGIISAGVVKRAPLREGAAPQRIGPLRDSFATRMVRPQLTQARPSFTGILRPSGKSNAPFATPRIHTLTMSPILSL